VSPARVGRWRAECPECTESGMGPGAARENPESGRPNAFGTRWGAVAHVWVCVRGWGGAGGWGRAHGGAEVEDGVVGLGPQAEGRQHGRRLLERPHRDAGRGGGEKSGRVQIPITHCAQERGQEERAWSRRVGRASVARDSGGRGNRVGVGTAHRGSWDRPKETAGASRQPTHAVGVPRGPRRRAWAERVVGLPMTHTAGKGTSRRTCRGTGGVAAVKAPALHPWYH